MKKKITIITLALFVLTSYSITTYAQQQTDWNNTDERMDSLASVHSEDKLKTQKERDKQRMDDAKDARKSTKATAKEARRVENDANDAAYDSKIALRKERKAQKARRKADKQAGKAVDSRYKSDQN